MPRKIRELKALLRKAGFKLQPGKGSHTKWRHPKLHGRTVTLSGNDGTDAQEYQEKQVEAALRALKAQP